MQLSKAFPKPIVATFIAVATFVVMFFSPLSSIAADQREVLRYEVTWKGGRAGHGDITTTRSKGDIKVTAQAVSDGLLKTLLELWTRVQAVFGPKDFRPKWYQFHLKSSLLDTEVVNLKFDHRNGMVSVQKRKGDEVESHAEKIETAYDPITAAFLLRSQPDLNKPMFVDIYDGKDRARLFVTPEGRERVQVKGGVFDAAKLGLRLVRIRNDKELGTGHLWISDDSRRIPLLLTSSPFVGTVRFELVKVER